MKIWKSELAITDTQTVFVPKGAEFLTAQMQRSSFCLWFLCDDSAHPEFRTIAIYGTGNPIPDEPGKYIATVQPGNGLVWHVFEVNANMEN